MNSMIKNISILEEIIKTIVSFPNSVSADYVILSDSICVYFFVDKRDFEILIGKNGRTIHALRSIASTISIKQNNIPAAVHIETNESPRVSFVEIEKGSYYIGSQTESDAWPVHEANIGQILYVQDSPVTYYQWKIIYNWAILHGYNFNNPGNIGGDYNSNVPHFISEPVTKINWFDAVKWCNALSEYENRKPLYYVGNQKKTLYKKGNVPLANNFVAWNNNGYRLLTETEWEICARAGSKSDFFWGNDKYLMNDYTWNCFNSNYTTHPVKTKLPNKWNLYDFMGNVYEWCWDWYGLYSSNDINQLGTDSGESKIVRGGSYDSDERNFRCADRPCNNPESATHDIGFRICRMSI